MKAAVAILAVALCMNGAFAARSLSQSLPTLGQAVPARLVPAPAPAPTSGCAVSALTSAGNYTLLLGLIQASSEANDFLALLTASNEQATIFAPTDGGITKAAAAANLSISSITPDQLTSIIMYHILPSQLKAADLVNGYSFNTLFEKVGVAQSVLINGSGTSATITGAKSSAPIIGSVTVCNFNVYPIDGVLLPDF